MPDDRLMDGMTVGECRAEIARLTRELGECRVQSKPVEVEPDDIVHDLKTWPGPFKSLRFGFKNFEYRRDDRGFNLGHILLLREWNEVTEEYSGEFELRRVGYIVRGCYGIPEGYCIMSWDSRTAPHSLILERQRAESAEERCGKMERVVEAAKDVLAVRGRDIERSPLPAYMERPFSVLADLLSALDGGRK